MDTVYVQAVRKGLLFLGLYPERFLLLFSVKSAVPSLVAPGTGVLGGVVIQAPFVQAPLLLCSWFLTGPDGTGPARRLGTPLDTVWPQCVSV